MYRPIAFRLTAALLALGFATAALDSPVVHPCPMHDALPPGLAGHAPGAMAGMPGHASGRGAPGAPGAHVHGCTCLGSCAGAAGAAVPAGAPAIAARLPGERALLALAPATAQPRARARHFLPFAHAPPPPA